MKTLLFAAGVALALSTPAAAQVMLPAGARIAPGPQVDLPASVRDRAARDFGARDWAGAGTCAVDPAVTAVTLTKGGDRQVSISYEVTNRGRSDWSSGARQQNVSLVARNGNTGRAFRNTQRLTEAAAARSRMASYASPFITDAFDDFEFGGEVEVSIAYDPDILIDGNRCNDDANAGNNVMRVDGTQIMAFLRSSATSRTFR